MEKLQFRDRKTGPALRRAIESDDDRTLISMLHTMSGSGHGALLPRLCLNDGRHILAAALEAGANKCIDAYLRTVVDLSVGIHGWDDDIRCHFLEAVLMSDCSLDHFEALLSQDSFQTDGLIEELIVRGQNTGARRLRCLRLALAALDLDWEFSGWSANSLAYHKLSDPLDLPCLKALLDTGDPRIAEHVFEHTLKSLSTVGEKPSDPSARDIVATLLLQYPAARGLAKILENRKACTMADYPEARALTTSLLNQIKRLHPEGIERAPRFGEPVAALLVARGKPLRGDWIDSNLFLYLTPEELVPVHRNGCKIHNIVRGVLLHSQDGRRVEEFFAVLDKDTLSREDLCAFLRVPGCVPEVVARLGPASVTWREVVSTLTDSVLTDDAAAQVYRGLVDAGIDFTRFDNAAADGFLHTMLLQTTSRVDLVKEMLADGFDLNRPNSAGYRPLQCALLSHPSPGSIGSHHDVMASGTVRLLLERGADAALAIDGEKTFAELLDERTKAASTQTVNVFVGLKRQLSADKAQQHVQVKKRQRRPGL